MRYGKAPSGLQYAVRRDNSAVAYCAISIKCGTRDEAGYHGGIAHFVEHTLFKGTSRKSAAVIALGLPFLSYVPIISTGCGSIHDFCPNDFIVLFIILLSIPSIYLRVLSSVVLYLRE